MKLENLDTKEINVLTLEQLQEIKGGLFGIKSCKVAHTQPCSGQEGEYYEVTTYTPTGWGNLWGADCNNATYTPCNF